MSVILDVGGWVEAQRLAIATIFGVDIERVDVRESLTWEGTTPVITIDLRLDGQRAPDAWWELTGAMIEIARSRAKLANIERRIAALPWWRRWFTRLGCAVADALVWWRTRGDRRRARSALRGRRP